MPSSPVGSAGRLKRSHLPRDGREESVPLHTEGFTDDGRKVYVPVFPRVYLTKGLTYGKAWEVLNSHYLQRGRYGKAALMGWEHHGLWIHMQFLASHGERFYASDIAANAGTGATGPTKPHTVGKLLDRLENLRLIIRVRNGGSRDRWVSIVLAAPFHPDEMRYRGPELMSRVETNAVAAERREAGRGKWPLRIWDAKTLLQKIKGEPKTQERFESMQYAVDTVRRRFEGRGPGTNDTWTDFENEVRAQWTHWGNAWNRKLYMTVMTYRELTEG